MLRKIIDKIFDVSFKCCPSLYMRGDSIIRKYYWELRAKDIDKRWGFKTSDYIVLKEIIKDIGADSILDIGCGSGRLFALYQELKVGKVVGQDISQKALNIASKRIHNNHYQLINCSITEMTFPPNYFDLVISNRVLQHIPPNCIIETINKIAEVGQYIYINEMYDSDLVSGVPYMFRHSYHQLFNHRGFEMEREGRIDQQSYFVFKKLRVQNNAISVCNVLRK